MMATVAMAAMALDRFCYIDKAKQNLYVGNDYVFSR
jgi:hypothetical protein